jgi:methylmalonyl-CoA mutase N-terminal domain/subunit
LRTQQIIAHESGVTSVVDPLGGSYFLESLTDEVERQAHGIIDEIDRMGGALRALEAGYFQRSIAESAYRYQRQVETGEAVVVGVNRYTIEEETPIELTRVDPAIAADQRARLQALRSRRNVETVSNCLARLQDAARGTDNLVERIVECVEGLCTLGEISDAFRSVFGVYQEVVDV